MRRKRFSEEQMIGVLKEHEAGAKTADLCRKHGISEATFYNWKSKYGGLEVSEAKRLWALEGENAKLKRLLADAMLDSAAPALRRPGNHPRRCGLVILGEIGDLGLRMATAIAQDLGKRPTDVDTVQHHRFPAPGRQMRGECGPHVRHGASAGRMPERAKRCAPTGSTDDLPPTASRYCPRVGDGCNQAAG